MQTIVELTLAMVQRQDSLASHGIVSYGRMFIKFNMLPRRPGKCAIALVAFPIRA